jgi:transposase-like protein
MREKIKRTKYSNKLKLQVITDYLEGKGSLETLAYKYGLRNHFQV